MACNRCNCWLCIIAVAASAATAGPSTKLVVPEVPLQPVHLGGYSVLQGRETAATAQPFFVLPGLLDRHLVAEALEAMSEVIFDDHNDEADWLPAFEVYVMEKGLHLPDVSRAAFRAAVAQLEERALPFVRQVYGCSACVACTTFVRRYLRDERLHIPGHFDVTAYSTIILPLSPASNYSGGFFVQPGAHIKTRTFVPLDVGDVLVHDFTLNHGIEVLEGGRFSLIIWVSESQAACDGSRTPWHAERALRGDVVAQHILGMMYGQGNGAPRDEAKALEWTLRAAEGGLVNAQFSAGTMYFEGQGTEANRSRARYWYTKAASQGDASAQMILARMYSEGIGAARDEEQALYWFRLCQEQQGAALMGPPSWSS